MKLYHLTNHTDVEIESAMLVIGSSLAYNSDLTEAFSMHQINLETELLDEEVAKRLDRVSKDRSLNFEFEFVIKPKILCEIHTEATPLNLIHPYNYFHFLIEALPSYFSLVSSRLVSNSTPIISGKMHLNMYEALSILTGGSMQLLQLDISSAIICRKAILSKSAFHINELVNGRMNSDIYCDRDKLINLRSAFRNKMKLEKQARTRERIFIVRISQQRNIINMNALIEIALKLNYKIVYPERYDFISQVAIFSNASRIVGPTGAWLANLMFADKDTHVSILNPITVYTEKTIGKTLGDIFGIKVENYFFNSPKVNSYQPIHSDFLVDIDQFSDILEN